MRSKLGLAGLALAMTFGWAGATNAVTFDLTSDHCTGTCGPAPFGTVDVTQVGANVNFVVDLAGTNTWAKTGAVDFQAFKFNATGVVLGDISVTQTFAGQTLAAQTGAFNGDGTGNFLFGIACTTCGNGASAITSNLVFSVANATIADLTAPNNLGNIFVADIFNPQTGNTGPVDVSGVIPEPETYAMLLAGLGMMGFVARRRKQRAA